MNNLEIVLFKSFRIGKINYRFHLFNQIMLCEGRGNIILFKIRFQRKNIIFKVFLQSLSESIYIFHVKDLNKISFYVNLIDDKQKNKKHIS